jgi:hypothetical protein
LSRRRKKKTGSVSTSQDALKTINRVVKQGASDKREFFEAMDHTYFWWAGKKSEIYKGGSDDQLSPDSHSEDEARHYPLLWAYAESLIALIASEITPVYIGKFAQGKEYLGEVGNAVFEAIRDIIGWDRTIVDMFLQMILFQSCVTGPYLDRKRIFPNQIIGLRVFNPRQYYQTRNCEWDDANERVLCYPVEKKDLKFLYPDKSEEIDALQPGNKDDHMTIDPGQGDGTKVSLRGPYIYGDGKASDTAIDIWEAWIRDFSSSRTGDKEDTAKIDHEHQLVIDAVTQGVPTLDTIDWLEDWDLHPGHIDRHSVFLADLKKSDFGPGSDETVQSLSGEFQKHIDDHQRKVNSMASNQIGVKYAREDGWRYVVVANKTLVLEDGDNPYLEYGIREPPLAYTVICPDPVNNTGKSWLEQLVDMAATVSSMMNDAEYMLESRQGNVAFVEGSVVGDEKAITNDGRVPIKIRKGAIIAESIMNLSAPNLPPQIFEFVGSLRSFLEESAGLYQAARGGRPPGVRSGQQLESMISQNETSLQLKPRMLKPALRNLATWIWQMSIGIGIDLDILRPVIDDVLNEFGETDIGDLENAPFTIGIKIKTGPTTSNEDRRSLVEHVIPGLRVDFQGIPELADVTSDMISEVWGEDYPALKRGIKKLQAARAKKIAAEAQAALAAAKQAGPIPGQGPSPEEMALAAPAGGGEWPYSGGPNLQIA